MVLKKIPFFKCALAIFEIYACSIFFQAMDAVSVSVCICLILQIRVNMRWYLIVVLICVLSQ